MARVDMYNRIIESVFFSNYTEGSGEVDFSRVDLVTAGQNLGINLPKNLGDVLYAYRYRRQLPKRILAECGNGEEWVISGIGSGRYRFRRVPKLAIEPQKDRLAIKVPNATPEIVAKYALGDEQATLAKIRYNRLIDMFLGITAYSLQSHLRTQVDTVQLEIDEIYIGVGKTGSQYVVPVQAKIGSDKIGRVQAEQDAAFCRRRFPELICRQVAAQLMTDDVIALFELALIDGDVKILDEDHYKLVPASDISPEELALMQRTGQA